MSGPQFFETRMGRIFFEHHVPNINRALESISKSLEQMNKTGGEDKEVIIGLGNELKLKVSPKCTDYKGVAIDIVKGDKEYPVLLLEEQNNKVSIYLWEEKDNEDFTQKSIIQY